MSKPSVAAGNITNLELLEALHRHPAFREVGERDFLLQKAHPRDWPLSIG
jgi:hypothetical protein